MGMHAPQQAYLGNKGRKLKFHPYYLKSTPFHQSYVARMEFELSLGKD